MGDTQKQALDTLAQQAGAEGNAYDNALFQLVTGFKDELQGQMAEIVALVKGGKAPTLDEDEATDPEANDPEATDPEGDEDPDEGDEGAEGDEGDDPEGDPGFVDTMAKGNEGGDLEDYVDATDWVAATGNELVRLRKAVQKQQSLLTGQAKIIRTQQEQIAQLVSLQRQQGVALATILGPMGELIKGVHTRIFPEGGEAQAAAPTAYDRAVQASVRGAVREQIALARADNGSEFSLQVLAKAHREGIISGNALRNYKHLGVFSDDAEKHKELAQQVRDLESATQD